MTTRQKFELSWKSRLDPGRSVLVAITAEVQQARDATGGLGQGAKGYAKRDAAAYANALTSSQITQVVMASLLK
jgi:hypothetical protein